MAHNVHGTASEIERLAAAGTAVAHCPGSNAALGSGCFPLRGHIEAGVTCALGTDVGGGLGFGMMKEGLHAYLTQRLAPDPEPLDAARLLFMATRAGAEALGLGADIGDFGGGKAADFVYLRPPANSVLESVIRHADSVTQALASLFTLAGPESVREVRVEGEIVVEPGRMTLEELNAQDRCRLRRARSAGSSNIPPWIAERAWNTRPFASLGDLHDAMISQVRSATLDEQLGLLRAHPDLGHARPQLSSASAAEQSGAGLDSMTSSGVRALAAPERRLP